MAEILVVEDEPVIRSAMRRFLERNRFKVAEAGSVDEARRNFDLERFELIISDLRLPGAPGTDLIALAGSVPVLIMTSYASLRSAVEAMRMGAVDYIAKPFDHSDLLNAIRRILQDRPGAEAVVGNLPMASSTEGMIGECPAMVAVYERVSKVAPTVATVLITGETGTGKELVARAIHRKSNRAAKPLICVNCAAIPETLIESELFGYEKGAFTGAASNRMGLIEAADGGTLFLDEIGELPIEAQARLLRFIQEGEIRSIGSVQSRKVDVRLLTATHRNLKSLSEAGHFRADLYYRINVVELALPPLRERGDDVVRMAQAFLTNAAQRHGKPVPRLGPVAVRAIAAHSWPGNVRELENAVERAVILFDGQEITAHALGIGEPIQAEAMGTEESACDPLEPVDPSEDLSLEEYFQRFVLQNQDSMSETELARRLGVSRKCLWERRQRLGIPRRRSAGNDDPVQSASA